LFCVATNTFYKTGERISLDEIPGLFKTIFVRVATFDMMVSGFRKTGRYYMSADVFRE
jgi:hypothetical protein